MEVRLAYDPDGARLTIEDFDTDDRCPPLGGGTGYGLTGVRERAELLGGTFTAGHTDNGVPGERPQYGPAYYAAYVLDPDGTNVESVWRPCWL